MDKLNLQRISKRYRKCGVKTGRHTAAQLVQCVSIDLTKSTSDAAAGGIASVMYWRWLREGVCNLSVAMLQL